MDSNPPVIETKAQMLKHLFIVFLCYVLSCVKRGQTMLKNAVVFLKIVKVLLYHKVIGKNWSLLEPVCLGARPVCFNGEKAVGIADVLSCFLCTCYCSLHVNEAERTVKNL